MQENTDMHSKIQRNQITLPQLSGFTLYADYAVAAAAAFVHH
jgi:hypothetical protein